MLENFLYDFVIAADALLNSSFSIFSYKIVWLGFT